MSNIAQELETAMSTPDIEDANRLEEAVRSDIAKYTQEKEEWNTALALLRKHKPELVGLIGSLADVEYEIAPELPLPPARVW